MRTRGFSIIELVAVIAIVGALAVFALPRLNIGGFERYAFREELLSGLRYAQKTAMASGCDVAVALDAGTDSFALFYRNGGSATTCGGAGNAFGDPVQDPAGGGAFTRTGGSGADLQTGGQLVFDGFGNHAAGPTQIDLAGGGPILVEDVTGYIHE
ncbi:MAG: type II secretion system protein [Halofilum sp. (in: g-proteobacteria)]|nr:type II secretion system protein [Halofilum sp. (in: g-proteobacteria)]